MGAGIIAVALVTAGPAANAASASTTPSFTSALAAKWRSYLATRPGSVSVALYDRSTGRTIYVTKSVGNGWETASTVKLDILAHLLSRTGQNGNLTAAQLKLARPMISVSDNAAASSLWNQAGGQSGMDAFFRELGTTATAAGAGGKWGLTKTTALDQLKVLRAVSYPGAVLSKNARATATGLLNTVVPAQRWGLTAGVPTGVSVQVKNGWLPYDGGWVVNSLAHVHGANKDYVMAVYTRNSATEQTGINTIAGLSRLAWSTVPAA
ncbi:MULTISPECIES: serine hydrolase [Pseudofrankia]|uniref:serine hydrolase n=1 Tax=Pseudofrankia TaxID=2994363 RepID=UPI000234BC7D|nr:MULTISPECIES: serine hydrolase [Pseudofrankia]